MPVPTSFNDLDTVAANNSPPGTESAKGNVDNYLRAAFSFSKQNYNAIQSSGFTWCGTAGGTANAITLTPVPAITTYQAGQVFRFQAQLTNAGTTTVAISGLSAIAVQINGAACAGGEIVASQWYEGWLSSTSAMQVRACAAPNQVGAINFKRATVAATATTTPLWATANGNIQDWTGTPTITDFPAAPQAGAQREVYPAAGTIITNAGNISVQGNANYTVAAGDKLIVAAVTTTTFYVVIAPKIPIAIASQTATDAGASDTTAISPLKLRNGFAISLGTSGYLKFPSWLGGLIVQWTQVTTTAGSGTNNTLTYPLTFPTDVLQAVMSATTGTTAGSAAQEGAYIVSVSAASLVWQSQWQTSVSQTHRFIIIGY